MSTSLSYACHLYGRAWEFSSPAFDLEGTPYTNSEKEEKRQELQNIVDCLKWAVRLATLGVCSYGALSAASSFGASARTIQMLTKSSLALLGGSAIALAIPVIQRTFLGVLFGAFVGAAVLAKLQSKLGPVGFLVVRPFQVPFFLSAAALGSFAYFVQSPRRITEPMNNLYGEVVKDYEAFTKQP